MTKDKVEPKDPGVCERHNCTGPGVPLHVCPYSYEIRGDDETLCNCCAACERECADDV